MRKVKIEIEVTLDDSNIPADIHWVSDDSPSLGKRAEAKAFFLSVFDKKTLETLKIDLWTKEFEIGEMNRMMYYHLKSLSDSYFKATNNTQLANDLAKFTQYFGEELGFLSKP